MFQPSTLNRVPISGLGRLWLELEPPKAALAEQAALVAPDLRRWLQHGNRLRCARQLASPNLTQTEVGLQALAAPHGGLHVAFTRPWVSRLALPA